MDQNKTPRCTRVAPWEKHKHRATDAAHVSKGPQITQRHPRSRDAPGLGKIIYGVDLRFPWFTSHSRENTFSKYRWVLLSAGGLSLPKFHSLASATFSFGLDFCTPRSLGIVEFGGHGGAHLDVELPEEGQSPSQSVAGSGLLSGYPWSRRHGRELSWEHEIRSGVDALPSQPSRPASPQTAWQVQPERAEPSKCKIRRYQTSDLKRGKSGDFL